MHINSTPLDEIALVFRNDPETALQSAFYSPIYAKSTLKRRRSRIPNGMIKNINVSNIELKLRPLNEEESKEKKKHCSTFDVRHCVNDDELKEEKDINTT